MAAFLDVLDEGRSIPADKAGNKIYHSKLKRSMTVFLHCLTSFEFIFIPYLRYFVYHKKLIRPPIHQERLFYYEK